MPTYRSITTELHSQFDIETLPEYFPRSKRYSTRRGITTNAPKLFDDTKPTCSVFVPVLPSSQLWITYSIAEPIPEGQLFLFKLFIDGVHITSWSCGKEDGLQGKTMFGLYERELDDEGKKRVEKRMFFFSDKGEDGTWEGVKDIFDLDACVEIRVHRAHARKRIARKIEEFSASGYPEKAPGVNLVNAGRAGSDHPKRFYKFALIDPVDEPHVVIRYLYRSWKQIKELGLLEEDSDVSDTSMDASPFGPIIASPQKRKIITTRLNDKVDDGDDVFAPENKPTSASPARSHYIPSGAPGSERGSSPDETDEIVKKRHSGSGTPPRLYRLSVPPSLRFDPPNASSTHLPTIPQKSASVSSLGYRPHPAYPVEDWAVRTPSPVKSYREGIRTPPMRERKVFSAASSLMTVVTSAWKRRGTPASVESSRGSNHQPIVSDELD